MILIFISILILSVICKLNISLQSEFRDKLDSQIATFDEMQKSYTKMLAEVPKDSEEYNLYKLTIEANVSMKNEYNNLIYFYDCEDWSGFYEQYEKILNENSNVLANSVKKSDESDGLDNMIDANDSLLAYITYLDEHNLVYEDFGYPIYALSFLTSISKTALPILVLICCVYILSQLYTMEYYDSVDIGGILPVGRKKRMLTRLLLGFVVSAFIYVFIGVIIFLFSFLITGNTGFNYPLLLQGVSAGTRKTINLLSIFPQWFLLGILFYFTVGLFTFISSHLIKEESSLFLSVLFVVVAFAYMPRMAGVMMPYAHYFPTTYLNLVNIVNGRIAYDYSNPAISFSMGVIVLGICIVIQGVFVYLLLIRKKAHTEK